MRLIERISNQQEELIHVRSGLVVFSVQCVASELGKSDFVVRLGLLG